MLLQANDFKHLCSVHNVEMQMGGSDQWGNITAGIDLIRKTLSRSAFGATWPLVTKSDGSKFGKTADGAVWLDAARTSPFQFRQFWMQTTDDDAAKFLFQFSLMSLEEIRSCVATHSNAPEKRHAQRTLADEMTLLLHGSSAAQAATAAAEVLFGADPTLASPDAFEVVAGEVQNLAVGRTELDDTVAILVRSGLASSNSDARRSLQQKALRANGVLLDEENPLAKTSLLHGRYILMRKGKTTYRLLDVGQ